MSRIVSWTGHRPDLFDDPDLARQAVDRAAHELADAGGRQFLVGGQRGVDTWAALAAISLVVPFRLVLPFDADEFARDWAEIDRATLHSTLERAVDVRIAGGFSERNRILAREPQLLIAVWTGTRGGGTAETVALARAAGTPIREILLNPSVDVASASGRGI